MPSIAALYRYPVKGLSPHPLQETVLRPGETIPFDRIYAIENGPSRFDPMHPRHLPKINFLMLMRNERLAALDTRFDEETHKLTIRRDGRVVAQGVLADPLGRRVVEQFMAGYMDGELKGAPRVVHADGHSFSDRAERCLHLVNLATVRAVERVVGRALDPLRFRANIYFEGERPFEEFEWMNGEVRLGGALVRVFARTGRCEATNVEPGTGRRDMAIPPALIRAYGNKDMGVYARVVEGAVIRPGDPVEAAR